VQEERQEEAREREQAMVDELRKAESVRDRLEALAQIARYYRVGYPTRVLLENLGLDPGAPSGRGRDPHPSGRHRPPWRHLRSRRTSGNLSTTTLGV